MFNSISNIAYVDNIMPVTLELKNIVTPQKTECPTENCWLGHIAPLAGNPRSTLCRAYNFKKNLKTCFTLLSALSSALVFCGSSPVAAAPPTASGLSSFSHQVVPQPFVEVMLIVASASVFCYFVYVWIPYLFRVGPINREEITNATKTMLT